jgi:hypothetical protein
MITETGRRCPGLSIITANGLTLSLAKPKKLQNLQVSTASPGKNAIKLHLQSSCRADEWATRAVTFVKLPLFCQKRYSRGKSTDGEGRRNRMWHKILYMRDRCDRDSYNDKAQGNGRGMKKWSVITKIPFNRIWYNRDRLYVHNNRYCMLKTCTLNPLLVYYYWSYLRQRSKSVKICFQTSFLQHVGRTWFNYFVCFTSAKSVQRLYIIYVWF